MIHDLKIDTGGVRECAAGITRVGARVVDTAARRPAGVLTPYWAAGDESLLAADAARQRLTRIGDEIAEAARQIVAAVLDYESADERAADRIRGSR